MKQIARPFLRPRPPDAQPDPDLSQPGLLRDLVNRAGLTPIEEFDTSWAFEYPVDIEDPTAAIACRTSTTT
jgi:hypothetical protein